MKFTVLILANIFLFKLASAQYVPTDRGSFIEFHVKHFGVDTKGSFSGLLGKINFDSSSLNDSKFEVAIDANSIQTGVDMRDNHLRKDAYFDAEKYPLIRFVSTKIISTGLGGPMVIYGQLTIKNHTKDISFPFTASPINKGYLFKGSFNISRKDFEVGSSGVISDNVDVSLSISVIK